MGTEMTTATRRDTAGGLPPAVIVGGNANALSVARSLAARGVRVFTLNEPDAPVHHSRHVTPLCPNRARGGAGAWADILLDPASQGLAGAVLLACDDDAVRLIVEHHDVLADRYRLEETPPALRAALMDKTSCYEIAVRAGVPAPAFRRLRAGGAPAELPPGMTFPVILKPVFSPDFRDLGVKYLRADDSAGLRMAARKVNDLGIACVLMDFVPGPDSALCSFYTYMDEHGRPLFRFTKTLLRRHPANMGGATYHITRWFPDAAEVGLRFFTAAGLRGLGNLEFKRDPRDGTLKLIECNPRFTASDALIRACGLDLAWITYARLTGLPLPEICWREERRMAVPAKDFRAFHAQRAVGGQGWGTWLGQMARVDCLPYFQLDDPLPSLVVATRTLFRTALRLAPLGAAGVVEKGGAA